MGFSYNNILLICEGKRKFRPQAPVTVFLSCLAAGDNNSKGWAQDFFDGVGVWDVGLGERRGC